MIEKSEHVSKYAFWEQGVTKPFLHPLNTLAVVYY